MRARSCGGWPRCQRRGRIAGRLENLPVLAGETTAYPYLGIAPPPPNYMLEAATLPPSKNDAVEARWLRRFGVTHGVWGSADPVIGTVLLDRIPDPVLDRLMASSPHSSRGGLGPWKLVRVPDVFPTAWIAREVHEAPNWAFLFLKLSLDDARDQAWFEPGDRPPPCRNRLPTQPAYEAGTGKRRSWNTTAPCFLILPRTYYPGWFYQVDGGAEQPVLKVNSSMQGAQLVGSGTSRLTFHYSPTGLAPPSRSRSPHSRPP